MKPFYALAILLILASLACRLPASLSGQPTPTSPILADTFFSGNAYIDSNANGELDASDQPLEGARLVVAGFSGPTGKDGLATVVIPGGWDKPVIAQMYPPEGSAYTLISPAEATLQSSGPTHVDFLFAAPTGSPGATPAAALAGNLTPAASITPTIPATPVYPADPKPRPMRPGSTQNDVVYCTTAAGFPIKMDIHYPEDLQDPAPLVVYIHGGAWKGGDKSDGIGTLFTSILLRNGYIVAAINYRLAPDYPFPAEIEDARCAIRHLRANAAAYGLDPKRVGAIGGSAGGHLVALLGAADDTPPWPAEAYQEPYHGQSSRIQAVVDLFGPTDLAAIAAYSHGQDSITMRQVFGNDPGNWETFSPVRYITPDDPPFLILHGENDNLVSPSQSQTLHDRLKAAGVPSELVFVQNAGHGFKPAGGPLQPGIDQLRQIIAQFFDEHLR